MSNLQMCLFIRKNDSVYQIFWTEIIGHISNNQVRQELHNPEYTRWSHLNGNNNNNNICYKKGLVVSGNFKQPVPKQNKTNKQQEK